ncbi:MAG: CotH kinase family protein, partial [Planctomycetales bacterium]|nr:CotH kinase family protein [Planctomycetales bacterium]
TTDGSEPAVDNPLATLVPADSGQVAPEAVVHVERTTNLRATAVKPEYLSANIDSQTYLFLADVLGQPELDRDVIDNTLPGYGIEEALLSIPTISLTTATANLFDPTIGIMSHPGSKGESWERATSVELIYPDGRDGFQIDAGLRIHGGISRNDSFSFKRSFRLFFREEYGAGKLEYPLFADTTVSRFDQLVLRASSTDSWAVVEWPPTPEGFLRWQREQASYIRDQWMKDTQLALGQPSAHGTYVHLFLNGTYWGQYTLMERPIDSFQAEHFGGDKGDYDVVHDCPQECGLQAGTFDMWNAMMALAAEGLETTAKYQRIQGNNPDGTLNPDYPTYVDVENLIDYMIPHVAFGADDYPQHNWWAARQHGIEQGASRSAGFRFFIWDQEISNNSLDKMNNASGVTPYEQAVAFNSPSYLYDRMRQNPDFQRRFGDRVHALFFNGGALTPENNRARWKSRAAEIDHAIVAESARWGDARRSTPYRREVEWLADEAWMDLYWEENHPIAIQRFRNVGLYPTVDAPTFSQHGGPIRAGFVLEMF